MRIYFVVNISKTISPPYGSEGTSCTCEPFHDLRLELMGALFASRLARTIYKELRVKPEIYLWTDSQIVLRWLHAKSSTKKAFIGVQIVEIQSEWSINHWKFVPTKLNPADDLSKGVKVSDISNTWFYGPSFLYSPASTGQNSPCYRKLKSQMTVKSRK